MAYGGGEHTLPRDHRAGMRVPAGGASCATCRYVSEDRRRCGEPHFVAWNGSDILPEPAERYCSDWFEPAADEHDEGRTLTAPIREAIARKKE